MSRDHSFPQNVEFELNRGIVSFREIFVKSGTGR